MNKVANNYIYYELSLWKALYNKMAKINVSKLILMIMYCSTVDT